MYSAIDDCSEFCDTLRPILDSSGKEVAVEEVVKQTKFIPWLVEKVLAFMYIHFA